MLIRGLVGVGLGLHLMVVTTIRRLGQRPGLEMYRVREGLMAAYKYTPTFTEDIGVLTTICDMLRSTKDSRGVRPSCRRGVRDAE